jgi:hypothetical protein
MHNPQGFAVIFAGMWGGRRRRGDVVVGSSSVSGDPLTKMQDLLFDIYVNTTTRMSKRQMNGKFVYTDDQDFLWKYVWPLAQNDCLQHDSYYCVESGGVAFPMTRQEAGEDFEYVWNSFNRMSQGGTEHKKYVDASLVQKDMVDSHKFCLELRYNLTDHLDRTMGSSSVLSATPYTGRTDVSSSELMDSTNEILMGRKPVTSSTT